MGCASSKQSRRCRHCKATYSPPTTRRSFSLHHRPAQNATDDSYHSVALASTTLGSLNLEEEDEEHEEKKDGDYGRNIRTATKLAPPGPPPAQGIIRDRFPYHYHHHHFDYKRDDKEFEIGVIEAKAWSKMIDEKIPKVVPKTPVMTPPGEPETINAWELMEGLEEDNNTPSTRSPPFGHRHLLPPDQFRSFSFHVSPYNNSTIVSDLIDSPKTTNTASPINIENQHAININMSNNSSRSPLRIDAHISRTPDEKDDDLITKTIVSDFDPEVISAFRKALEQLSPKNPFRLNKPKLNGTVIDFVPDDDGHADKENGEHAAMDNQQNSSSEKKINGTTGDPITAGADTIASNNEPDNGYCSKNQSKGEAVLYFTSLRGVRKTYEECCNVRVILKGLGVKIDERDVSMHSGFKDEVKELLLSTDHDTGGRCGLTLPRLFLGNKYMGGAEEIKRMHEQGQLEKVLQCCDKVDGVGVCKACGDIRFVPCEACSGSCKIYYEAEEEEEEEEIGKEEEDDKHGFRRCSDCNENGLVRCPLCCS